MSGTVLLIYGGGTATKPIMNDMYTIDPSQMNFLVWQKLDFHGGNLLKIRNATMTYVGSGRMLLYGGFGQKGRTSDVVVIENAFSPQRTSQRLIPRS